MEPNCYAAKAFVSTYVKDNINLYRSYEQLVNKPNKMFYLVESIWMVSHKRKLAIFQFWHNVSFEIIWVDYAVI